VNFLKRYTKIDIIRALLEELEDAGGSMRDTDLFRNLKKEFPDLSSREFMKYLLQLEFNGCILVTSIDENTRTVELLKKCFETEKTE
jgi:hypothetical protein